MTRTLLALAKTNPTPTKLISLLGVSISVLIRLKNLSEEPSQRLPRDLIDGVLELYNNAILLSKGPLPAHTTVSRCQVFFFSCCFGFRLLSQREKSGNEEGVSFSFCA